MDVSLLLALITTGTTVVLAIWAGIQIWLMRNDVQESKLQRSATTLLWVIGTMDEIRDKRIQLYGLPPDHREWNAEQEKLARAYWG